MTLTHIFIKINEFRLTQHALFEFLVFGFMNEFYSKHKLATRTVVGGCVLHAMFQNFTKLHYLMRASLQPQFVRNYMERRCYIYFHYDRYIIIQLSTLLQLATRNIFKRT